MLTKVFGGVERRQVSGEIRVRLPCYNSGLSNAGTAEHNEAVAVTRWRLASVLLRRGGRGTRADGHSEHSILRARGTIHLWLRLRASPTAVDPTLGLVGCTSASAEPLHAAQKSAARLQLRKRELRVCECDIKP